MKYILLLMISALVGCASTPPGNDVVEKDPRDPIEGFNRKVFAFNNTFDKYLLKPVAKGYDYSVPKPVKVGVSNFFSNLAEVRNVINDILQWKWASAGRDTGRFLINSTLGFAGIFDPATIAGIEKSDGEDFGQTLAVWGVPQGPYIVLPFLGPSSVRGVGGDIGDIYTDPTNYLEDDSVRNGLALLRVVDFRSDLLSTEDLVSGDFYLFLREAYLQRREFLINDGAVEDDFGGDFDDFDSQEDDW